MELSNLTGSPCQDVFQFIISGHRRKTVKRPIRFRDVADSTDVAVTSSVLTSNECQSLFDRTISVETNIFVLCAKFQTIVRENASILVVVYSSISPAFV